jgi:hypothetical protein
MYTFRGNAMLSRNSTARAVVLTVTVLTVGCEANSLSDIHLPSMPTGFSSSGLSLSDDDPSVPKITPDSSIPILLTSNKQRTHWSVNGQELNESKTLKVKVPREAITITAQAPCYRPLEQRADVNGFGPMSEFEFTFATWDRDPNSRGHDCT